MKIEFTVRNLPPKKDGANSMWGKPSEIPKLKALRIAAVEAMGNLPLINSDISLTIKIYAHGRKGDLDNFITGICDGLMSARVDRFEDLYSDILPDARPKNDICYRDDVLITQITAQRIEINAGSEYYTIEIVW